jgi:hypothetical protein
VASYREAVREFAAAVLDSPLPWTRMRRVYALLGLARRYGAARVNDARVIALAAEMLDVHRLRPHAGARPDRCAGFAARACDPARVAFRPASQYALPLTSPSGLLTEVRMTIDSITADLKTTLRRLRLSRMLDTLPERLVVARQRKMPHQDFLLLVLSDEVSRRESLAATIDVLDPTESRDLYDILTERHRAGSIIVTNARFLGTLAAGTGRRGSSARSLTRP